MAIPRIALTVGDPAGIGPEIVLKALAGTLGMSLGDLLEGIVLHSFEGKPPFGRESMKKIRALREVYGLTLTAADSHQLIEKRRPAPRRAR